MKTAEFLAMTDKIRVATTAAMDAGNEFSTPWRIIGVMTAIIEQSLYSLPKSTREEMLKQLVDSLGYIEKSYEKVENEVRAAA
jgi:hypothetical protein